MVSMGYWIEIGYFRMRYWSWAIDQVMGRLSGGQEFSQRGAILGALGPDGAFDALKASYLLKTGLFLRDSMPYV